MTVRLDKWLQVARAFKTRSQATKACSAGRVRVNDAIAKPHRLLAPGDQVEIAFRGYLRRLEVLELRDRPVSKAEAALLFQDVTPPELARPARRSRADRPAKAAAREPGMGRPTKRDRRRIDRLRER